MHDFEEVGKGHFVVVLLHVGGDLFEGRREAQRSRYQTKFVDASYVDWILGAVLGEQEESLAEGVDVLLGKVLEVLRHDKADGSGN